jgi:hypothetical protein
MPFQFVSDVAYSSARHAVAKLTGCRDEGRDDCRTAVLVTADNWATETGIVYPGKDVLGEDRVYDYHLAIWPVPGGGALILNDFGYPGAVKPLLLGTDGIATRVTVSKTVRNPRPGDVLVPKDMVPGVKYRSPAELWTMRPSDATLSPLRHQPCECRGSGDVWWVSVPAADGTVYALIMGDSGYSDYSVAVGRDFGRDWRTVAPPADFFAPNSDGYLTATTRGRRIALAWFVDNRTGLGVRRLFVGHNGSRWRQIDVSTTPKGSVHGFGFTADRALLLALRRGEIWKLPKGSGVLRQAPNMPPVRWLNGSQGPLTIGIDDRTVRLSSDGQHWSTVVPGSVLVPGGS